MTYTGVKQRGVHFFRSSILQPLTLALALSLYVVGQNAWSLDDKSFAHKPLAQSNTYVLVHGATGGGWDWRDVDRLLSASVSAPSGADQNSRAVYDHPPHKVYRATLTGLGERRHLAHPDINLTTHVNDVVNLILFENLDNVILVGHSYGGMVITGVMNTIPERIKHSIFLDAFVPDHGMSAFDVWKPNVPPHKIVDGQVHFAWLQADMPVPGDSPQSLKTFTEPVAFDNPRAKSIPCTFIAFVAGDYVAQRKTWDASWRRAEQRGYTILTLDSDHNAQRSHPQALSKLLLRASH